MNSRGHRHSVYNRSGDLLGGKLEIVHMSTNEDIGLISGVEEVREEAEPGPRWRTTGGAGLRTERVSIVELFELTVSFVFLREGVRGLS